MRLVDSNDISPGLYPEWSQKAWSYVQHAAHAIGNVSTRTCLLDTGEHLMPVTVNHGNERPDNSYVVSPLTAYSGYAEYEIQQLGYPWLTAPLQWLTRCAGYALRRGQLDQIVHVNNWLLSTNLYPTDWSGSDCDQITRLLIDTWPDHAIGFRSLNQYSNNRLITQLKTLGYITIPSRQVYLFDGQSGENSPYLKRRDSRQDARLLKKTAYTTVPGSTLKQDDFLRLEALYNRLYLEKYCPLNPHFSAEWLYAGQRDGWLELTALRSPSGRIDGVLGWVSNNDILTSPVVGYDTGLPRKLGLYRLTSQLTLEQAAQRRVLLNMSAGAAHFKRARGGQPEIEYSLVYVNHLPRSRQRVWRSLSRLLHSVAVPVMRRFKL